MFDIFYDSITGLLTSIEHFTLNKPINIKRQNNTFLSCHEHYNCVDFYLRDDNSGRQKWILEKDETEDNIYYIKCAFNRWNYTQYLGCPNANNRVYLYTSKNEFTKWSITNVSSSYLIKYAGIKFYKPDVEIIIARYNEDVEWACAYEDIVTIYNKGAHIPGKNVKGIANVGREGHTYLNHITTEYDSLSNYNIFVQGDPFEHNETILFGIDNYNLCDDVQPLGIRWKKSKGIPPTEIENKLTIKTDFGLNYLIMPLNADLDYVKEFWYSDRGHANLITLYRRQFPTCVSVSQNFLERSEFSISKPLTNIRYTWAGLFAVKRDILHRYTKTIYLNLTKELLMFNRDGGLNGYILERLWLYIFELNSEIKL